LSPRFSRRVPCFFCFGAWDWQMGIPRGVMRTFVRKRVNDVQFDLDEIRAVFFRCNECRTAVSFPRIRWVSLPERCPNCGASWMHEPSAGLAFSDDAVVRAFQAANAFRDALQSLVTVARSAGFTVGMETKERSGSGNGGMEATSSGTQGMSHGGIDVPSS
jgi:hypothetical protein